MPVYANWQQTVQARVWSYDAMMKQYSQVWPDVLPARDNG